MSLWGDCSFGPQLTYDDFDTDDQVIAWVKKKCDPFLSSEHPDKPDDNRRAVERWFSYNKAIEKESKAQLTDSLERASTEAAAAMQAHTDEPANKKSRVSPEQKH